MGNMAEAIIMLYKEVWREKNVFRTFVGTKFLFPTYQRHHLVNERPVCARDDPLVVDDAGVGEEHAQVDGHLTNPYLFVVKLFSFMRLFFPHHDGGGHRLRAAPFTLSSLADMQSELFLLVLPPPPLTPSIRRVRFMVPATSGVELSVKVGIFTLSYVVSPSLNSLHI